MSFNLLSFFLLLPRPCLFASTPSLFSSNLLPSPLFLQPPPRHLFYAPPLLSLRPSLSTPSPPSALHLFFFCFLPLPRSFLSFAHTHIGGTHLSARVVHLRKCRVRKFRCGLYLQGGWSSVFLLALPVRRAYYRWSNLGNQSYVLCDDRVMTDKTLLLGKGYRKSYLTWFKTFCPTDRWRSI